MAEKCSSCDQMKKENATMRKAMMDTSKGYVEVVNENLALHRDIEARCKENLELRRKLVACGGL